MKKNKIKDPIFKFDEDKKLRIKSIKTNKKIQKIKDDFLNVSSKIKYEYNFSWMGIPIIQYPQDIIALQEIIFSVKPNLIIETGFAHGGSSIFYASILKNLEFKKNDKAKVISIDVDFRNHNLQRFKKLKISKYIQLIKGSSTNLKIFNKIKNLSKKFKKIMVVLDSDHSTNHVLKELELYSSLVSKDSYCVVFDTGINFWANSKIINKNYNKNSNPYKAVQKFMKNNSEFKIDEDIHNKLLITSCYSGYLKKIKH